MPSDIGGILRRNDPEKWTQSLARRPREALPFDAESVARGARIVLDTTVYIDQLQGTLPPPVEHLFGRCVILHCAVARAEIALSIGHLDPADPRTLARRGALEQVLERQRPERRVTPSERAWTEAALLAGILSRIQGLEKADRRALLNDAVMLMTAREQGAILVSRNISDMDYLTVLRPDARVILYDRPVN